MHSRVRIQIARSLAGLALLALPALASAISVPVPGKPSLRWKGKTYALEELPAELGPEVAEAARPLGAWAERKGYRMELTPEADCLLVMSRRGGDPRENLAWIAATVKELDGLLAPRVEAPATTAGGTPKERGRLEDFDLPPLQAEAEMPRLPHQVPVLLAARNPKDYESALDALVEACPWLKDWSAATGKGVYGLVLPRPLLGAWLVDAPANEEWDPRNELVNRLAQLLVIDRGGVQPYWLLSGVAWEIELRVRGAIYCFPYRDGFVGIGEHGGWAPRLQSLYSDRAQRPPTAAEIGALKRGTYVDDRAAVAWGTARWLLTAELPVLPRILDDLDRVRRKDGIEVHEDGSWVTRPNWDWPDAALDEVLRRHLGNDGLERLGAAFRTGL